MKLYIIGNGFDMHHGLPTSYWHYKTFLISKYADTALDFEEFVGLHNSSMNAWNDIEASLKINYRKLLSQYANLPFVEKEISQKSYWNSQNVTFTHMVNENELQGRIRRLTDFITDFTGQYLFNWLTSIDAKKAKPDLNLQPEDLYVTFNYLDTLESVYHIPDNHVYHIHGSIKKLQDLKKKAAAYKKEFMQEYTPIYGQKEALDNWTFFEYPAFLNAHVRQEIQFGAAVSLEKEKKKLEKWFSIDPKLSDYLAPSILDLEEFMDKSSKQLDQNFRPLTKFAWTHSAIDTIVVMGHSLNSVDDPYYKQILVPFFRDKLWVFYAYQGNTKDITPFIESSRLEHYQIEKW